MIILKWKRIPDEYRDQYMTHRSPAKIREDLVKAFDQIAGLKLWIKVLTLLVGIEGAVIGWLATSLLDCIQAGRHATALLR